MTQFPSIEDYILFIGGWIDTNGKSASRFWPEPVLQLANYDVGFITSVAEQIQGSKGMTDRQAELAYKIIEKYDRQLRKHGIEQPAHKFHRLGIREVNRNSTAYINDDGMVCLKFPFNEEMIATVKSAAKDSQGVVRWNPDNKEWQFALTEYNLSWAYTFASAHKMTIDSKIEEMFGLITEMETTPFVIQLRVNESQGEIVNAPESMLEWMTANIGFDDIYKLVDMAGVLGYTIDPVIIAQLEAAHGKAFIGLCLQREINHAAHGSIEEVLEWAKIVDRFPICVFNPNFTKIDMSVYEKYFTADQIQVFDMKANTDSAIAIDSHIKVVYTNKVIPEWQGRMPLLITYANLMHGATKRAFLGKAEKVVYHCDPLPKR